MAVIRVLPENVVNQIAAGEVVERPASAVKELVENSLDAGSTQIQVEIVKGGKSLIRIQDDGCGMSREDAVLSLERHATSKLETADGLQSIQTMGFRGEAMPAIASVSRLQMITRPASDELGTKLTVVGGTLKDIETTGCNPGTRIEVRDLYFNTPARRKFLKSEGAETAAVTEVLSNTLLAHPERQFKLVVAGKTTLMSPGDGDLKEAAQVVFDRELVKSARLLEPAEWSDVGTR